MGRSFSSDLTVGAAAAVADAASVSSKILVSVEGNIGAGIVIIVQLLFSLSLLLY